MGSCLSKKNACASSSSSSPVKLPEKIKSDNTQFEKKKVEVQEPIVKKETFIIKHRKSHEIDRSRPEEEKGGGENKKIVESCDFSTPNNVGKGNGVTVGGAGVRTSSCTKEEVDAILIQCGRLSRSSSTGKAAGLSESGGRKYSGSKRSFDFDNDGVRSEGKSGVDENGDDAVAKERENRQRHRSQGRRRTPSRERDREQQRSGSRERGGGGGRRVSRSPGRRSDSPMKNEGGPNSNSNSNSSAVANGNSRPGKMVSVPPTVSSGSGGEPNSGVGVKRIQVKRNVGGDGGVGVGSRTAASPRARSPARVRASNENQNVNSSQNQQQPISLSRSNSRKAEHSPYRRNPLGEIDTNIMSQAPIQKPLAENKINATKLESNTTNVNCKTKEQIPNAEETRGSYGIAGHVAMNVISSGPESLKPTGITRSRSSRLSRDLDINPESLSNPNTSYTALLLEDIQNFHHKNNTPQSFSLPPCVTKACSILEAVADLNSSTSSNLSSTLSENRWGNPLSEKMNKSNDNRSLASNQLGKIRQENKEPFVESEVVANDDLMEPSFHKYVTVKRGTIGGEDVEDQESSGSNSFVSSQQQWISPHWEPNSAESTDRWTSSSRSVSRQNDVSQSGRGIDDSGKRLSAKRRDFDDQKTGIGRGRVGSRGPLTAAATASN